MFIEATALLTLAVGAPSARPDDLFDEDVISSGSTTAKGAGRRASTTRAIAYAVTGLDSNVELTSNDMPSSGVLKVGGELEYAHRLPANLVGLGAFSVDGALWRPAATGGTVTGSAELSMGGFLVGSGKIRRIGASSTFPRLRMVVTGRYGFGTDFAGGTSVTSGGGEVVPPPASDDEEEEEEEEADELDEAEELDGTPVDEPVDSSSGLVASAFMDPFHRISARTSFRFDASRALWFELSSSFIRVYSAGDVGQTNRNFNQPQVRLRMRYDLMKRLSLRIGYRYEHRFYDERTNDLGQVLIYQTHRPQASVLLDLDEVSIQLRYQLRYRRINDPGRDRLRHGVGVVGDYRLTKVLSAIAEVAYMDENRIDRPDRDWNRFLAVAGVQFMY